MITRLTAWTRNVSPRGRIVAVGFILTAVAGILVLSPGRHGVGARLLAAQPTPRVHPPPLDRGEWIGTSEPIQLKELRGKIVLLDFWTLC